MVPTTCPAVTSSPSFTVSVASRPGYFADDVHLRRFDAAVGFHDALGHIAAAQAIYQCFHRFAGFFEGVLLLRLGVCPDD